MEGQKNEAVESVVDISWHIS